MLKSESLGEEAPAALEKVFFKKKVVWAWEKGVLEAEVKRLQVVDIQAIKQ